ncbi:DUF5105 domain-containing protein [Clostridium sp. C2-6-12]|uniref:DUF5105 domain-containing protein n=1 Tax=Clostridium sp. C2-6-12 TaxID=2698832 RepID=UPI00136A11DC|nr:DUF5105 domain-containing protein [Clostridium sp. C2-6-12]
MKNKKFTVLLLVTILLLSCVVTGCGKKITPKECAQVWWEIACNDMSNVSKINITEEQSKTILDNSNKKNLSSLKTAFTSQGLTVTDEQVKEYFDAIGEAAKKATVTIEEVSNDGKTSQVKYKTTYIDANKIGTKAANDAAESVKALGLTNKKDVMNKYSELFVKNLTNEFKNATFSEDTNEKTFTFTKKDKIWVPENQETLSTELGSLISGKAK